MMDTGRGAFFETWCWYRQLEAGIAIPFYLRR